MKRMLAFGLSVVMLIETVIGITRPAQAIIVFDPGNFAQNVLQVLHNIQSNVNEALMIKNQLMQLENELKNLESLDFNIIDEYSGQFQQLFSVVGKINGLIQNLSELEEKFEEIYPNYSADIFPVPAAELRAKTREWQLTTRDMIEGAAKAGAKVLKELPQTQSQLEQLMISSQGAVGILQATQAGNQIAASIAGGLTALNTQVAMYHQATSAFLLEINSSDAATKSRMEHILDDWALPYSGNPIPQNPY